MREWWTYKKLGEVCEILNGFAFKSGNYTEQGIRVLRITNVQKGLIVDDDPKYYPFDEETNLKQYMLKEGDLLMSLTGNVGRVGLLQKNLLPAALNQRVACLRIKNSNIQLEYIFHLLNSDCFERDCIFNATGIAQKNMSTEWLKKYNIPIPSLSEQQSIVAELDKINELISLKKAQLSDLDSLAQSIFYDMFGDPVTNEKGWEKKKYEDICLIITDGEHSTPKRESIGVFLLSARNIHNHRLELQDVDYIGEDEYNRVSKRIIPQAKDILISCSGSVGRVCSVPDDLKFQMVRSVALLRLKSHMNNVFFEYLISSDFTQEQINKAKTNSAQANLFQGRIKKLIAIIPPLTLQQEFAKRIELIEQQKAQISSTIKDLETLLASRMQYWFD